MMGYPSKEEIGGTLAAVYRVLNRVLHAVQVGGITADNAQDMEVLKEQVEKLGITVE